MAKKHKPTKKPTVKYPKLKDRATIPVAHLKHNDKRVNIPTEELRGFVAEDEITPKKVLYPRDPSLDPQLVWKGKDEQDSKPLEVPVVPIYIQEKIHPQAIIEDLRVQSRKEIPEDQIGLFGDFNGIKFEEMIDFYQHEQNWTNRAILGDSLLVMTSLAEKERLKGKVQSIYFDPPYGIKFGSNWQVSTRKRDVKDGKAEDASRQPEQVKAFRDTWQLGIHSYLAYLRDRFVVCRDLLTESGSLFVQIGDENVHLVRNVLDEVFGSENFLSLISFSKSAGGLQSVSRVGAVLDYIVWYAKDLEHVKYRSIYEAKVDAVSSGYTNIEMPNGTRRSMNREERHATDFEKGCRPYMTVLMTKPGPGSKFSVRYQGRTFDSGNRWWGTLPEGIERIILSDRIAATENSIRMVTYYDDFPYRALTNLWSGLGGAADPIYVVQTTTTVVERCLLMTTDPGDLMLDPTCVRKGTRVLAPLYPPVDGGIMGGSKDRAFGKALGEERKPVENITPGDFVFAHDGKQHKVLRVIKRQYKGKMVGIRHKELEATLWLTEDHRVLANRRVQHLTPSGGWSGIPKDHFERSQQLRHEMSPPERVLWSRLQKKQLGIKFRRQHPIGPYIADFYSRDAGLVVEVDGSQHYETEEAIGYDKTRDEYMQNLGLRVLRYGASETVKHTDAIVDSIYEAAQENVLSEDETKQWRFAGSLAIGDMVFFGVDRKPVTVTELLQEETTEEVYDLEVEGVHSFLTEVCAVHNCGSGTTAYVAEQWGRRWITIDTSRVALALARTRIMSAKYPYYLLGDSSDGKRKEMEIVGRVADPTGATHASRPTNDIKRGFVYKRVPHITLKSIANNEEIDTIHAKWQQKLEPIRAELNKALKQKWEEWEIQRDLPANLVKTLNSTSLQKANELINQWWEYRRARQKEIDDSIAKRADTELLYDQPYEDNKRIRVAGPFTVESLSPHRVLSPADENLDGTVTKKEAKHQQDFTTMILDNLRKSGVQNTFKNERLKFDRLESFAGVWVHAKGEYTENGKSKRVAVSIGPEHGTVGPDMIKEAAKEAVEGAGTDLLIVCGFAFDPHVSEEAKRYGKLNVLTARMNPDLAMGDELLKKTGAGNLFMVFGEPDLDVKKQKGGKITVTIKGLDVYDPTTGEIRSSSTDDIACWFIDTNYNGESFFVRHAYFTGAEEPYDKLKRALRAEIDESSWSALYSTTSRPFDLPNTGKIAVKVINHYGDEVLRVYEVKQ
jgi:very-short-patch-repair endonuclease/DNA modification methylase